MTQATVLAIDQGTTGTTALLFDSHGRVVGRGYRTIRQYYPRPGFVEHDPAEIWRSVLAAVHQARRGRAGPLAAIGITNQRETTILWDRATGAPLHRAIVWQDRRTAPDCDRLRRAGHLSQVRRTTGLVLDPYFSATKLAWLLRHVPGAAARARAGRIAFGTVDAWLIWNLTRGRVHATDPTNASRTLLLNLTTRDWDDRMLRLFGIPRGILPDIRPSAGSFGRTAGAGPIPAGVPIAGVAGDQQAALFGQGAVRPGAMKVTYGTGAFLLLQTGSRPVRSRAGLLTTMACGPAGGPAYALEGSVFIAGAAVQWLRDEMQLLTTAAESETLARSVPDTAGVCVVPAFTGLGAPYWDAAARGTITGLTRGAGRAHLVRATLEAIAHQVADVVAAMGRDLRRPIRSLLVDGGACANDFLMQFQADILHARLDRPRLVETTAAGAAYLAGLGVGLWKPADLARLRRRDRLFRPAMGPAHRRVLRAGWATAVARARSLG